MQVTESRPTSKDTRRSGSVATRRFGYAVAVAVNLVMLVVANSLLDWGWPAFLTPEFSDVLPVLNLSLTATILINVAYMNYDPPRFKSACEIVLGAISMTVLARTWTVFPFDFSPYRSFEWIAFDWDHVARLVLIVAMVGVGIGMLVAFIRWVSATVDPRR